MRAVMLLLYRHWFEGLSVSGSAFAGSPLLRPLGLHDHGHRPFAMGMQSVGRERLVAFHQTSEFLLVPVERFLVEIWMVRTNAAEQLFNDELPDVQLRGEELINQLVIFVVCILSLARPAPKAREKLARFLQTKVAHAPDKQRRCFVR